MCLTDKNSAITDINSYRRAGHSFGAVVSPNKKSVLSRVATVLGSSD